MIVTRVFRRLGRSAVSAGGAVVLMLVLGFEGDRSALAASGDYDGVWQGVGQVTRSAGGWHCESPFGVRFTISGNRVSGRISGEVSDDGVISARADSYQRSSVYQGTIEGDTAQGEWRVIGACAGTWSAKRVGSEPTGAPAPEPTAAHTPKYQTRYIGDQQIKRIAFSQDSPASGASLRTISQISLDLEYVYVIAEWGSHLEQGQNYVGQYFVFYPSGKEKALRTRNTFRTVPDHKTWRSWKKVHLDKEFDEPGDWRVEIRLGGRKVAERLLKVLPARRE